MIILNALMLNAITSAVNTRRITKYIMIFKLNIDNCARFRINIPFLLIQIRNIYTSNC
jgi:hypothetical protein